MSLSEWYLLDDDHNVIGTTNDMHAAWANKKMHHRVAVTTLPNCEVSTVFLGLDHSFGSGPPLLFETLVFGGPFDQEMERYATWVEAEYGHVRMVDKCQPIMTEDV